MPTRQKKPSIVKQFSISIALSGFILYMGQSAISGKYGMKNREILLAQIEQMQESSKKTQQEIEEYKKRIALFDPQRLDPDILTQRARELLAMAHENDRIIIVSIEE